MWESRVPNDRNEIGAYNGCSNAVAREAAPSSASGNTTDIVQRMPSGAVNLSKVASTMGRGHNHQQDGESGARLEDDAQVQGNRRVTDAIGKTSDGTTLE